MRARWIRPYRKALAAFFVPLVAAVGAAMQDGDIKPGEIITALGMAMVTAAAVYRLPNQPRP